jgi:type IV fimbrial biogenesis protein FimT
MMMRIRSNGFSFIELTITIATSAVLFGIAVPALSALLSSNHLSTQVNDLSGALSLSRSHAIKSNRQVVICKSGDTRHCDRDAQWGDGWIVYEDRNRDRHRENNEPLIEVNQGFHGKTTLKYRAFGSRNYIAFRPSGVTRTNGTFIFCVPRHGDLHRALILSKTGRVRVSETRANGDPLRCPS